MITTKTVRTCIVGGALLLICAVANATNFNEYVNETAPAGTTAWSGSGQPVSDGVQPDGVQNQSGSNPPNGPPTLRFELSNNGPSQSLIPGDVLIWEDHVGGTLSDILRFENWGTGYVYVYSDNSGDDGPPTLADNPFPTNLQLNVVDIVEPATGKIKYLPTSGQPGFSSFIPAGSTFTGYCYYLTSNEAVPEPSSLALVGIGIGVGLGWLGFVRARYR